MINIRRLCIIGVGLIGGSLARALKNAGAVGEVVGCARSPETLQRASELGVIDRGTDDCRAAVQGADMVVIATPVGSMGAVFSRIATALEDSVVITDVGSVKGSVVESARATFAGHFARFVPGHPIAGTESSGVEASVPELFQNRCVILTPSEESNGVAVKQVRDMWQAVGARVVEMPVAQHDQTLAATSHLPHVLAYTLVDLLASMDDSRVIFQFAAGGFHDFSRIASSDPVMWRDICLANRGYLSKALRHYSRALNEVIDRIDADDAEWLVDLFSRAKRARDKLLPVDSGGASPE